MFAFNNTKSTRVRLDLISYEMDKSLASNEESYAS